MSLRTTMRPRNPPLRVDVVRPGSVEADMHPSHAVPVAQPVNPASLVSTDPNNSLVTGVDGRLFVSVQASDKSKVHDQSTADAIWLIQHDLGKFPAATVVDSAGDQVEGDIEHIDQNTLRIVFSSAFSGRAFLN